MRKTLKNVVVAKTEEIDNQISEKQKRLEEVVVACSEIYKTSKDLSKRVNDYKDEIKQLFKDLNLTEYTATSGAKITMSVIDKSTIDNNKLINYLKEHNMTQYIHTKEFVDENEIIYAVSKDLIKAEDLAPMQINKTEYRINIK